MKKAVFLDRDGTLIKDKGFISHTKDLEFYPYTFDCLRKLQKEYLLFIVTNQPGVARGAISLSALEHLHHHLLQTFKDNDIIINEIYTCIHTKADECNCRKPHPFFFEQARRKFDLEPESSFMIGDHPSDAQFALNAKANGIYLLSGHGRRHYHEMDEAFKRKVRITHNLKYATDIILASKPVSANGI